MSKTSAVQSSLQGKIVLIFLCLGAGLAAGAYAVMNLYVHPAFEKFEEQLALNSLSRVQQSIESQLDLLDMFNQEYSAWDDTLEFVLDPVANAGYIEENMYDQYWADEGINAFLLFGPDRKLIWGKLLSATDGASLPVEANLLPFLYRNHPLISHAQIGTSVRGLLHTPEGLLMLVSRPITNNDDTAPVTGSLLVGRFLGEAVIEKVRRDASVDIQVYELAEAVLPERIRVVPEQLAGREDEVMSGIWESHVYTRSLLLDVTGEPVAVLETHTERRISALGAEAANTALAFLCLSIGLFIVIAWLLLRRVVVQPISALKSHMKSLRVSGDLSQSFDSQRRDEIGALAFEFNKLTTKLGEVQHKLEGARDSAEASSHAKSDFLANMSHEIRTPMNGVIGMTDVLLRTELSERQNYLAETIRSSGEVLLKVINNILDFSKISAGQMPLNKRAFDVRQLAVEANSIMANSAQAKGIEYVCQLDRELPAALIGDSQRITQVLINLIGNAIKFTRRGEVVFAVECLEPEDDNAETQVLLRFSVRDSGIGIAEDAVGKVFESFAQADASTTREYGGTGLGLAISKELVEAMGGEIGVNSRSGEGSEFYFTLPLEIENPARLPIPEALNGLRVLLVDDNSSSRSGIATYLADARMYYDVAVSGTEALQKLEAAAAAHNPFDLLVYDLHMPDIGRRVFANKLAKEGSYPAPKLLSVGTVADEAEVLEIADATAPELIAKPVLPEPLYQKLYALVAGDSGVPETTTETRDPGGELCAGLDILVAEDNRVNQELITLLLQEQGARVTLANDGEEALARLRQSDFDLVIMDCQMPGVDGYEASRKIRELALCAKNGSPLPVLAMTANVQDEDKCLAAGMDAYIAKPYDFNVLLSLLERLLFPDPAGAAAAAD
ncbi:MAG: response regulator [Halieaceae bacterium]